MTRACRAMSVSRRPSLTCGCAQMRRLVPQVNASVLLPSPPPAEGGGADCAAVLAAPHAWWGWYAFDGAAYAPHRARFAALLAPSERVAAALDAALANARRGADGATRPLLGVHVRCGEGFTPLSASAAASAEAPAGESGAEEAWAPPAKGGLAAAASSTTGAWRDTGIFWAAPLSWCAEAH